MFNGLVTKCTIIIIFFNNHYHSFQPKNFIFTCSTFELWILLITTDQQQEWNQWKPFSLCLTERRRDISNLFAFIERAFFHVFDFEISKLRCEINFDNRAQASVLLYIYSYELSLFEFQFFFRILGTKTPK